jgi:hypothetical protein
MSVEDRAMRRLGIALALILFSGSALAGPTCTTEPKEKWLSESAMKAKIAALGYKYRVFKVTRGNCYEIYGQSDSGKRIEIYFHPITGNVVEVHMS